MKKYFLVIFFRRKKCPRNPTPPQKNWGLGKNVHVIRPVGLRGGLVFFYSRGPKIIHHRLGTGEVEGRAGNFLVFEVFESPQPIFPYSK